MPGGIWLDVLLVGCLLAIFLASRPASSVASPGSPVRKATGRARRQVAGRLERYFRTLVRQAGFDPDSRRWDYWLAKSAGAALPPLFLFDGGVGGTWIWLSALIGFFLPDLWLMSRRRRRRRLISKALPYFLDLLVAFLHSGMGLVDAFRRTGREAFSGPHPLAREVELVGRELDAGRDPSVAFRDLAERTGVSDLRGVAAALRVGMRLGAPIRETLLAQADALLVKRREDALRRIHRAELQMMFPVMLAGFPVYTVLVFFPILMDLLDAYFDAKGMVVR